MAVPVFNMFYFLGNISVHFMMNHNGELLPLVRCPDNIIVV